VDSALTISSRFIANKALVTVEERGQHATTIDADNEASIAFPVTVLVNQYTASASEITAGALQDDGIGELIGTKTFGKGVMQTLTPLPDGAAIKITTAHYLTPRRRDINLRGIDPDLRVEENRDARFGDLERDAQLRAAVQLLQRKIASAKPGRERLNVLLDAGVPFARQTNERAVIGIRNVVHEAAHQIDSEPALAVDRRQHELVAKRREAASVVVHFDHELLSVEGTTHGKPAGTNASSMLDGVPQRFSCR
jgi:peptidase S41-like protein